MNDLQLKCFLCVAELRSFSKAVNTLYISQPTLSAHIKNIESSLGVTLFNRASNPIELTEAGGIYYVFFSNYRRELDRLLSIYSDTDSGYKGSLKLGILSGFVFPPELKKKIFAFQSKYPDIDFIIENCNPYELVSRLMNGSLDICLNLTDFSMEEPGIITQKLLDVPKCLVYSAKLVRPSYSEPKVEDFKNNLFFCVGDSANQSKQLIIKYCSVYGFYPVTKVLSNIESVMTNVYFGNGVTITDEFTQFSESPLIKKIRLYPGHSLGLSWVGSNNNPSMILFNNFIT